MDDALAALIKLAREMKKPDSEGAWTQNRLADALGKSKQWISNLETGKDVPSLALLIQLHELLVEPDTSEPKASLAVWLLTSIQKSIEKENLLPNTKETTRAVLQKTIGQLIQPSSRRKRSTNRSLEFFPYYREPLTIVCGDRRDLTPKTRGDIFAHSVSIADLTFLLRLELPSNTMIKSDKLFVLMSWEYLEREFGNTNLLVIGSPAVNFAARVINNYSVFRFNLPPWLKKKEELIRTLEESGDWDADLPSPKELQDPKNLELFWKLAQKAEDTQLAAIKGELSPGEEQARTELIKRLLDKTNPSTEEIENTKQLARMFNKILEGQTAKSLMNHFRRPGLIDFADATVHGTSTRGDNDFALISLAPNPFAKSHNYVCVLVAGIHGPGTAHALRALAEDDFLSHPFGGVIEVELNQFDDWPGRFQHASWRWQTKAYDHHKLLNNLKSTLAVKEGRPREFENLTDDEIRRCVDFVRQVSQVDRDR
jgi:transcriptional regulator with XRE-family HTH domain